MPRRGFTRIVEKVSVDTNLIHTREVWLKMWIATAGTSNCNSIETPTRWADEGIKAYKERFCKKEVS